MAVEQAEAVVPVLVADKAVAAEQAEAVAAEQAEVQVAEQAVAAVQYFVQVLDVEQQPV